MLEEFHSFQSRDSSYIALQGYENRITINVRVSCDAIDDLPQSGSDPTAEQRTQFVRHNLDAIRVMVEKKLEDGGAVPEDWHGRSALGVHIGEPELSAYLRDSANHLSFAAFDPGARAT